jgi:ribonucleotide reductase alpha subunit
MRYPFESAEAAQLNRDIFETIYFGSVEASIELAEKKGHYATYEGLMTYNLLFPRISLLILAFCRLSR